MSRYNWTGDLDPCDLMDPFTYAEVLKTAGNQDFKSCRYAFAIRKYDEAIGILIQVQHLRDSRKDLAVLFCNRSNAFYNLEKWAEALYSAEQSIANDPTYIKGYYRVAYSLLQLGDTCSALMIFYRGLLLLWNTTDTSQIVDFLVGILGSVNDEIIHPAAFFDVFENILRHGFGAKVWQMVLERLAKKDFWGSCLLLAAQRTRLPRDLHVTQLSLKDLFEKYVHLGQYERMEGVPSLVQWLIFIGADPESIGPDPLHSIMRLCIKAKENSLLKWLLNSKPKMKEKINHQDKDGSTILHVVAAFPTTQANGYNMKRQSEDVQMLLNFGVDPSLQDVHNRVAADLLRKTKNFKAEDLIKKHLARQEISSTVPSKMPDKRETAPSTDLNALLLAATEQFTAYFRKKERLKEKTETFLKNKSVKTFLQLLSLVQEIPPEITCDIADNYAKMIVVHLLFTQKWHEVLLLLTRNASGDVLEKGGLFKNCCLSDFNIGVVVKDLRPYKQRIQLLRCLLERGASPDGYGAIAEKPLRTCLKKGDFQSAYFLLSKGADPLNISLIEGDTPLHASVSIILNANIEIGDIGVNFLNHLLDLYSSKPSEFPYLDPNTQDKQGNTIMHILFQNGGAKNFKRALDLLSKFEINLNLTNTLGKDARHRIKKNDMRLITWEKAVREARKKYPVIQSLKSTKSVPTNNIQSSKPHQASLLAAHSLKSETKAHQDESHIAEAVAGLVNEQKCHIKNPVSREEVKPLTLRETLAQKITVLIKKLELCKPEMETLQVAKLSPAVAGTSGILSMPSEAIATETSVATKCKCPDAPLPASESVPCEPAISVCDEGEDVDASELANLQDFDNMTWEIECTSEALKKLGSKSIPHYMKKKIILAVQQLGNGDWVQSLQKRLKYLNSDIQLYEAKLDKGGRMLWELAIDFSPRCSEDPEMIIETEQSLYSVEKSGRVYTEIIRIWDIVLDHNKLNHAIDNICSAYNRGLSCILRKKLKGISKSQQSSSMHVQKRIPQCYVEDVEVEKSRDLFIPDYFPPASAVETEYNIMKFHSFSTNMALNIISEMNSSVEYPFRVGELEYAVIDLNPKPMEAIILIGRSGTGKTTCCLYRLWKTFHSYWEKAESVGGPWLVKNTWHRRKQSISEGEDTEEEDTIDVSDSSDESETSDCSDDEANKGIKGEDHCSDANEDENSNKEEKLEHFHQIFITKNHVLCQEVQRNFTELSRSAKATSHFKPVEPTVYRLQDLKDENFPLFATSKQLLLLLDASMPDPFFLRNEDGSLKRNIAGWSTNDELLLPDLLDDDDEGENEGDYEEEDKSSEAISKETDPRVFVTFDVFANELWPKMVKGKSLYNAALVWKEIKSFLKGSFEALNCPHGRLSEEQYIKLGRKRAPNFQEDRKEIYRLFCLYQQAKSQRGYFDEEDFLFNLSQRLQKLEELSWSIHELYGDEIQDFTQAELALLMRCINDPNSMFLTGDTAQSIMKGVSFRFSDLRSLFHYASIHCSKDKHCAVRKPKRIYQLYQNYRSHSGILRLASGVVDLLQYYFPESFDRLPRDCGLFDGPKSTLLESCSVSDLAILLRGNKRRTQPIEFGAHQVILVANEMAKEKIPEELSLALVLTIYEAKGLEFDDVLLYNFFTDSEASKEWRIISSFVTTYQSSDDSKPLIEVPIEKFGVPQCRPLALNPEMHKMLNGELKQLYTAITRARVNLWIFDENREKRAPAFEYFMKRDLIQIVKTDEDESLDDSMFVKTSTPEEWIAQGEYYAKHQCWKVAAKCYQKGGARDKEKLALAHDSVIKVQTKKASPKEKQMEYMELSKTYLECQEPKLALKCLTYAKEFRLCAELCEKMGKAKDAAYFYKRIQDLKSAARCFEQIQEFELALNMYCQEKMYEEAAHALERYRELHPESKLSYTTNQFYLEAAAEYLSASKLARMNEVLTKLDTEDQLIFLKSHKRFTQAADLMKSKGRDEEAAMMMRQHGELLEAANLTTKTDFQVSCLLAAARCSLTGYKTIDNVESILEEVLELCWQRQLSGYAEATLIKGMLKKDCSLLKDAFYKFNRAGHNAGMVEALFEYSQCEAESSVLLTMASPGLDMLVNLSKALLKAGNNAEKEMVKMCFEFFGILQLDHNQCLIPLNEGARILQMLSSADTDISRRKKKGSGYSLDIADVTVLLRKHLLMRMCCIAQKVLGQEYSDVCPNFLVGLDCNEKCKDFHRPLLRHEAKSILQRKVRLATINGLLLQAIDLFPEELLNEDKEITNILPADKYLFCKSLLDSFFPKHFHQRILSENIPVCKELLDFKNQFSKPCKKVLNDYINFRFKIENVRTRRESTDLWLEAMHVFILSSQYPEELESFFVREERYYNKEFNSGEGKRIDGRFGMLLPDHQKGDNAHMCFMRLLQSCIDQLYVDKNPENCKRYFFRFMNVIIKKRLVPGIGNTVMLLEFQFVVCCAVLMRLQKKLFVYLPKSYIALLHFWEFMFSRKNRKMLIKDTFSILWEYIPKDVTNAIKEFRYHLFYLARVLCGDVDQSFNVILDAFNEPDFIISGEAERAVVLCLTMLVNIGGVFENRVKPLLRNIFQEIKAKLINMKEKFSSKVPERLVEVVERVTIATDIEEIVDSLQNLLIFRDDEHLVECHWRWDSNYGKGAVRGIFFEKIQQLDESHLEPLESFEEPYMEHEKYSYTEEKEDLLAAIASQVQQKACVLRKLGHIFLIVYFCMKLKKRAWLSKLERPGNEDGKLVPSNFRKADVDQTQCDICGVKFQHNPQNYFSQSRELEMDGHGIMTPTSTDVEMLHDLNPLESSMSYFDHIAMDEHKTKTNAYHRYLTFFKLKVDPFLQQRNDVMQTIELIAKDHLASKEHSHVVQEKIQNFSKRIADTVEDVYKKKCWADAEGLLLADVDNLAKHIADAQDWMKKKGEKKTEKESLAPEHDYEHEVDDHWFTFEELYSKKKLKKMRKKKKL
ncbi:TPR and ankyrin repeat-containing protein 1 isoform X1 [Pleurodeles waltl]|uniref:TPR and ankyrin repeat-containing protein 1 isoform X1 n=1 Tax=Pleurodeles waltl TaxID=8319 RepID=UPI0037098E27